MVQVKMENAAGRERLEANPNPNPNPNPKVKMEKSAGRERLEARLESEMMLKMGNVAKIRDANMRRRLRNADRLRPALTLTALQESLQAMDPQGALG